MPAAAQFPRPRDHRGDGPVRLRDLAGRGRLGELTEAERAALRPAAMEIAHPIVYDVVTRRVARNRGHADCGRGLHHMEESCLEGFHLDLEAVVEHLLRSKQQIADLEGWLAKWARNATVDAYRRRRGESGALQRPRMTDALAAELGHDPWLCDLAVKILDWVGVPVGASTALWPLDSWAGDRAVRTGDPRGSTPLQVQKDVERVLGVLRRRPEWYRKHVEHPLGRKVAPVGGSPGECAGKPQPLVTADPGEIDEAVLVGLATVAVEAIRARLRAGEDAAATVPEVLAALFLKGTGADELGRPPGDTPGHHERLSALFGDPVALSGLVQRVLHIVRGLAD